MSLYPDIGEGSAPWHLLQYSDVLDLEFASALAEFAPVTLWQPQRHRLPFTGAGGDPVLLQSRLTLRTFPLLKGFARPPLANLLPYGAAIASCLLSTTTNPKETVLVCTTPFFAPVAELWPGPVVYWLTDLIARYRHSGYARVRSLDRRMCQTATLVCPNSERIAAYLREEAGCPADRCVVLPNATGVRSLLDAPLRLPDPLPAPAAQELQRPIAGVIGNLAENTDWLLLEHLLEVLPWLSWLFVGPTHWPIHDRAQEAARQSVMRHPRACFTGARPYPELSRWARAVDVAVLPYLHREPTFSGSSTRCYDHLAACHPIVATDAVDELRRMPLIEVVHTAEQAAAALSFLRDRAFDDEQREARWRASHSHTWRVRARQLRNELAVRLRPA